jgi:hypothetical protein
VRSRIGVFDYPQMRENEYNDGGSVKQKASLSLPLGKGLFTPKQHEW